VVFIYPRDLTEAQAMDVAQQVLGCDRARPPAPAPCRFRFPRWTIPAIPAPIIILAVLTIAAIGAAASALLA
jgi:hypothetical protein